MHTLGIRENDAFLSLTPARGEMKKRLLKRYPIGTAKYLSFGLSRRLWKDWFRNFFFPLALS
jgi:hypothetical protein